MFLSGTTGMKQYLAQSLNRLILLCKFFCMISFSHFAAMFNGQESLSDCGTPFCGIVSGRFERNKKDLICFMV
jgi:hypothetical protein